MGGFGKRQTHRVRDSSHNFGVGVVRCGWGRLNCSSTACLPIPMPMSLSVSGRAYIQPATQPTGPMSCAAMHTQ